jgi:DmsE family decaheme c-type cytochrome
MSCKIRRALDAPLIPAADRETSRRTRRATESCKRSIALLVSGVVLGALLGFAQPAGAGEPASAADDSATLRDFVQAKVVDGPLLVVAAATTQAPKVKSAPAAAGPDYVGSQACMKCHSNQGGTFSKTLMGDIFLKKPRNAMEKAGCEACHGPGSLHVKSGGGMDGGQPGDMISFRKDSPRPVEERNAVCLGCHEKGDRTYWSGSAHESRGLACTNCHQIMEKVSPDHQLIKDTELEVCFACHKDKRAQEAKSTHMPLIEGRMQCSSCHNPHGSATDSLLREPSINETCYKCHADKRGPFLWEHEPVRDSCVNCHQPHGTTNEYLLKVQRPMLCRQCHAGVGHGQPGNPTAVQEVNRSCQNCHTKIHGSNSPAGELFQR